MILESLFELVSELRQRIHAHETQLRSNEMQTRYALIDPLLRELGWDTSDPSVVTPEYSASGGRADYALLKSGRPAVMVEAKKLGEDLQGAVTQGITYCIGQGTPYFAVTDGQRWQVYETHRPVPIAQKKVVAFDVVQDVPGTVCLEALALWRPSVLDGSVRAGNEPVLSQDGITPDSPTESPGSLSVTVPEPSLTTPNTSATASSPQWKPLDRSSLKLDESGHNVQPVEIAFPDGSSLPVRYWWEITALVAGWLIDNEKLTASDCPISLGRARRYILSARPVHSTGTAMKQPKQVKSLYMEANYSAANHVDNARAVVEKSFQDPAQFKLRFP